MRSRRPATSTFRAAFYEFTEGTVLDVYTRLRWQQDIPECDDLDHCLPMNFIRGHEAAAAYCEQLDVDGYDDFRLPTVLELYSGCYPLAGIGTQLDPSAFPDETNDVSASFPSSTRYAGGSGSEPPYWFLSFEGGADAYICTPSRIRCVRNED